MVRMASAPCRRHCYDRERTDGMLGWRRLTPLLRTADPETLRMVDAREPLRWSERRAPDAPRWCAFRSVLVGFCEPRAATEHCRTRCTRSEGRPGLGEETWLPRSRTHAPRAPVRADGTPSDPRHPWNVGS